MAHTSLTSHVMYPSHFALYKSLLRPISLWAWHHLTWLEWLKLTLLTWHVLHIFGQFSTKNVYLSNKQILDSWSQPYKLLLFSVFFSSFVAVCTKHSVLQMDNNTYPFEYYIPKQIKIIATVKQRVWISQQYSHTIGLYLGQSEDCSHYYSFGCGLKLKFEFNDHYGIGFTHSELVLEHSRKIIGKAN